ncbi:unnamed protein product [Rhizophagus irregularis]|nr:unnamed protein product [Rhizophagus irregularis]
MNFENPKNLWKDVDPDEYQYHVTISDIDDSSCISTEFLNEIKSHLQIYLYDVIPCYGITQDPDTKDYMMVLEFYLPEPINSDCLDCQLDESILRKISQEQDDENSVE